MTNTAERLFFALWPDQRVRNSLSEAYAKIQQLRGQGRLVNPANFHITLHFLGNIPEQKINCFLDYAEQIYSPSFELEITQSGYFTKSKVSWLAPVEIPWDLIQLQRLLGEKIKHCGFQPEGRPYRPHVTMARKVRQAATANLVNSICWKVDSFVLVKSTPREESVHYQVKASFPLTS